MDNGSRAVMEYVFFRVALIMYPDVVVRIVMIRTHLDNSVEVRPHTADAQYINKIECAELFYRIEKKIFFNIAHWEAI